MGVGLADTGHRQLRGEVQQGFSIVQRLSCFIQTHVNRRAVESRTNVPSVQRQAVAVVVQGLLELALDSGNVASDVGGGGLLAMNFRCINVKENGLQVAIIKGE